MATSQPEQSNASTQPRLLVERLRQSLLDGAFAPGSVDAPVRGVALAHVGQVEGDDVVRGGLRHALADAQHILHQGGLRRLVDRAMKCLVRRCIEAAALALVGAGCEGMVAGAKRGFEAQADLFAETEAIICREPREAEQQMRQHVLAVKVSMARWYAQRGAFEQSSIAEPGLTS
jgi:hypothetical protein